MNVTHILHRLAAFTEPGQSDVQLAQVLALAVEKWGIAGDENPAGTEVAAHATKRLAREIYDLSIAARQMMEV